MTPTIIDRPSPNHSPRKPGVRVDTVLLHHTASINTLETVDWLCMPKAGVSAHYVIGRKGEVFRLVDERLKAWHAGKGRLPWETGKEYDFNHRSIGIEVVNPGDGKTPFTEAQYAALCWLVPDIVRRLKPGKYAVAAGWPASPNSRPQAHRLVNDGSGDGWGVVYILGHRDVALGRKTDPADNFDWGRIRKALEEMM